MAGLGPVTTMNRSPDRHTFQRDAYIARCEEDGVEPSKAYLDMFDEMAKADQNWGTDPEQHKNDLEYDLRTTEWICDKAKASASYAQNIYAALCNQQWQKNDVWPLLKGEVWSCTWRYAGGIVADMTEKGDYIDWYCSGIGGPDGGGSEVDTEMDAVALAQKLFVSEGTVTDEVREDFFKLGWIPVDNEYDNL